MKDDGRTIAAHVGDDSPDERSGSGVGTNAGRLSPLAGHTSAVHRLRRPASPRGDVPQLRLKNNFPVVVAFHTAPEVGASAGGRTEGMRGRPAAHLGPPHAPAAPPPLALLRVRLRGRAQSGLGDGVNLIS